MQCHYTVLMLAQHSTPSCKQYGQLLHHDTLAGRALPVVKEVPRAPQHGCTNMVRKVQAGCTRTSTTLVLCAVCVRRRRKTGQREESKAEPCRLAVKAAVAAKNVRSAVEQIEAQISVNTLQQELQARTVCKCDVQQRDAPCFKACTDTATIYAVARMHQLNVQTMIFMRSLGTKFSRVRACGLSP